MKKIISLILFTFVSFLFLSDSLFASSYTSFVGLPHIEVNTLPTPSEDIMYTIYDYNDKYYVVEEIGASLRNIVVGDNLLNKTIFFDYDGDFNTLCSSFLEGSRSVISGWQNSYYFSFYQSYYSSGSCLIQFAPSGKFFFSTSSSHTIVSSFIFEYTADFCSSTTNCSVRYIYPSNPSYQYIKIYGDTYYEWKEISYYDWYEYTSLSNDFYLPFNFTDITSFDIFSPFDFSTFTDFEKITITILINLLFLCFLGLSIYIIIKVINKFVTWLF